MKKKLWQTLFVIIVAYGFLFLLINFVNHKIKDIKVKHVIRKNCIYIVGLLNILFIFLIWVQNLNSITIYLGVASAGLALALQEVILSIAGWALIMVRRPYEVGDRIEIDGIKGDIIDIRLFQT